MRSVRTDSALVVAAATVIAPTAADAKEPASEDPACQGAHSLQNPLPDRCLERIETDRPHQTDTPHVVPTGHTQIESALASVRLQPKGIGGTQLALFDNNYKFGLYPRMDLQLAMRHAVYSLTEKKLKPPGPYELRFKLAFTEQRGPLPAMTLVPIFRLPLIRNDRSGAGAAVFVAWYLPAQFELEVNVGLLYNGETLLGAAALTHPIVGALDVFAEVRGTQEYAGIGHDFGSDVSFGSGLLFAVTRDVQLDCGAYFSAPGAPIPFAAPFLGLSVRR